MSPIFDKGPPSIKRCPGCGAVDRSCNYDCPAENSGIPPVTYIRSDRIEKVAETMESYRDPESASATKLHRYAKQLREAL